MKDDELFPIVNENGETTGCATRRECHSGSMLLHPVVHLHIIDPDGRIYLQQRSMTKDIQPGKWDTAVGGHVDYGETVADALMRETREELGLSDIQPAHLLTYVFKSDRERELVNTFYITVDKDFSTDFDPIEISEARFWTIDEIESAKGNGVLTPNFESEFELIKNLVKGA